MTATIKKDNTIFSSLFALKILLFLACFNASAVYCIRVAGDIAIYLIIALTALTVILQNKKIILSRHHIILTVYAGFCLICGLFTGISFSMISQILLITWISVYATLWGTKVLLNGVAQILAALLPFCIVDIILFRMSGFAPFFGNPNRIGIIGFLCFAVGFLWKVNFRKVLSVSGFILILFSGARSPLLVLAVGGLIYMLLKKQTAVKGAKIIFIFVVIISTLLVTVYITAQNHSFMVRLNEIIYSLTGKNLFSGRQRIWASIFENYNLNKLFLGYGLSFDMYGLIGSGLSAHNQFIQVIVQQGIVGLLLWIAVLYNLYITAFKNNRKKLCAFAIMIMLYNLFEVFLLQNHFVLGVLVWLILFANDGVRKPQKSKNISSLKLMQHAG